MRTNTFKYLQGMCAVRGFFIARSGKGYVVNANDLPQGFKTIAGAKTYIEQTPISKYVRTLWDIRLLISIQKELSPTEKSCLKMINEVLT